jgi:UDP-N-acetyl-2-amino-2-deoxyglucuronate dehydrogenase
VKLGVPRQRAYQPAHIEARRFIQSGAAGEIHVAKTQFCRSRARGLFTGWRGDPVLGGAGALYGTAVHPIDLLRFLLDSEIEEVRAFTDEEPPKYPVDDMVYTICRFENGVVGTVISGVLVPRSENDTVIYGSKAKITCKSSGELVIEGDALNASMNYKVDSMPIYSVQQNIEGFNKAIETNAEPEMSSYNGLQMVKIANAILESSRQGKAVKIEKSKI